MATALTVVIAISCRTLVTMVVQPQKHAARARCVLSCCWLWLRGVAYSSHPLSPLSQILISLLVIGVVLSFVAAGFTIMFS